MMYCTCSWCHQPFHRLIATKWIGHDATLSKLPSRLVTARVGRHISLFLSQPPPSPKVELLLGLPLAYGRAELASVSMPETQLLCIVPSGRAQAQLATEFPNQTTQVSPGPLEKVGEGGDPSAGRSSGHPKLKVLHLLAARLMCLHRSIAASQTTAGQGRLSLERLLLLMFFFAHILV